ncbi:MAG TPA: hypothetical protein VIM17_13865 [Jatrophihabitantaceae bacterium]
MGRHERGRSAVCRAEDELDARGRDLSRRFTAGVDALSAPDHRKRTLGRALLVQLLRSSLATDDDRAVAVGVLDADATYNPATGGDLRVIVPGSELDETRLLREDEQGNTPEGEQP